MKTVLVTGSQGFIGSYVCTELLNKGYKVIGVDNYSKYGEVQRAHDTHEHFRLIECDVRYLSNHLDKLSDVEYIIAGAAMIGGISYFHKYAYDLLATNERILAETFDVAINLRLHGKLSKVVVLSSSMVFENTGVYPTPESEVEVSPPPLSTYGFQKLASEFFAKGAWEQYGIPYTIIRPFNCVGVGEEESLQDEEYYVGNHKLLMSHVLPDLIHKALTLGPNEKLPILGDGSQVRCYTNGKDIARGIVIAMESEKAVNEDFNISTPTPTTVKELAQEVWSQLYPSGPQLDFEYQEPFMYDVQKRIPDVSKAEELLEFKTEISLQESVGEVIEWMKQKLVK